GANDTVLRRRFAANDRRRLRKVDIADQAGMLVLLRRAAGFGDSIAVPICPEALREDVRSQWPKPAAGTFRFVLDVVFSEREVESRQETTKQCRIDRVLLFEEQAVIRLRVVPAGGDRIRREWLRHRPHDAIDRLRDVMLGELFTG